MSLHLSVRPFKNVKVNLIYLAIHTPQYGWETLEGNVVDPFIHVYSHVIRWRCSPDKKHADYADFCNCFHQSVVSHWSYSHINSVINNILISTQAADC